MNEFRIHKLFAELLTHSTVCSITNPGQIGGMKDLVKKHKCVEIVDGKKVDNIRACSKYLDQTENSFYYQLYLRIEKAILTSGSGPIAPCFDEFDYREESNRGKWYVIDHSAWNKIADTFKTNNLLS